MNYPAAMFYLVVATTLINLFVGLSNWWNSRNKVTNDRFETLEKEVASRVKMDELEKAKESRDKACLLHKSDIKAFESGYVGRLLDAEKKVERIGAEIRNLPQHRHINELSLRIEQLHGDVHEVSGALKGISRAVDLMNEHLINRGK